MALILGLIVAFIVVAGFIAYWMFMIALGVVCVVGIFWYFVFIYLFSENMLLIVPCTIIATGLTFWAGMVLDERRKARLKNVN
jgi:hypothetical protein